MSLLLLQEEEGEGEGEWEGEGEGEGEGEWEGGEEEEEEQTPCLRHFQRPQPSHSPHPQKQPFSLPHHVRHLQQRSKTKVDPIVQ